VFWDRDPDSQNPSDWCEYLQKLFTHEIPLSTHMSVRVDRIGINGLELHAASQPNVNIHGTAFAGSIYSLCALAAWGLLHVELRARDVSPEIVLADSTIVFSAPIVGTLRAHSGFTETADLDHFIRALRAVGKAEIQIPATVSGDAGRPAAHFSGTYAVAAPYSSV